MFCVCYTSSRSFLSFRSLWYSRACVRVRARARTWCCMLSSGSALVKMFRFLWILSLSLSLIVILSLEFFCCCLVQFSSSVCSFFLFHAANSLNADISFSCVQIQHSHKHTHFPRSSFVSILMIIKSHTNGPLLSFVINVCWFYINNSPPYGIRCENDGWNKKTHTRTYRRHYIKLFQ